MKSLYESDFYLWTLEQAQLLRHKNLNQLDWENLIEEVENLGRSEYAKVSSWVIRIIQHLLKIDYIGDKDCLKHWNKEIETFRVDIEGTITTTMEIKLNSDLEKLYKKAVRLFKVDYEDVELPRECPYELEDILGVGDKEI